MLDVPRASRYAAHGNLQLARYSAVSLWNHFRLDQRGIEPVASESRSSS